MTYHYYYVIKMIESKIFLFGKAYFQGKQFLPVDSIEVSDL